ncbi:hypothetical protein D3227_22520 [Mesorhizobium waimense]|uniref:Mur ligase central domain-containing protein n=1 Tax=Mesorhizobium waimense TaxID=1300307 RepID=A0A3A5KV38_9HYPH|nr:hypothetical protein [Mesorhizobium waimense]RJT35082.1 hypothetical protein D3227_22520 [Mesorhizobium waimense]
MNAKLRKIRETLGQWLKVYRAKRARAKSKATFIGITGSSAKSTTASLLGHILAGYRPTYTQVLALKTLFPGEHFWLPTAAAVATALELGVPPQIVAARAATLQPLANRSQVLVTEGGPHFLVDAAKAPWHSINLALDMMAKATVARKRIVLGQISDYAGSTRKYHYAYKSAREIADQVIYTGDNAHRSKADQADRDSGRFLELRTPKQVSDHIKATAVEGELILLKSSPKLHLERIALAWTHDVKCWVPNCGKREGCEGCGLFEVPFEEHRDYVRKRKRAKRRRRFLRLIGR